MPVKNQAINLEYSNLYNEMESHRKLFIDWLNFKVYNTIENRNFLHLLLPALGEPKRQKEGLTEILLYTHKDRIIKMEYNVLEIEFISVHISSRGLSLIFKETESYKPLMSIEELLRWIFKNCKWNKCKGEADRPAGITRIDFAIDDFESFLDLDLVDHKIKKGCYITRLVSSSDTNGWNLRDRVPTGKTIYLGVRSAETFIRIYDKFAKCREQSIEIDKRIDTWNRFEMEFKLGRANWFTHEYITNPNFNSYEAILGIFRLTSEPLAKKEKNKNRFEVDRLYSNFLRNTKKVTPLKVPQLVYDLENLERYVEKTSAGAIDTYVRVNGFKKLQNVLEERKEVTNKNRKYKSILEDHGTNFSYEDDEHVRDNKIQKFKKAS